MKHLKLKTSGVILLLCLLVLTNSWAGPIKELNSNWKCAPIAQVKSSGEQISKHGFSLSKWQPAVVPGTVLTTNGENRLAVIVYPIDPVGNPNGGQGGDGEIARNVALQYVAGWDWIQPIRAVSYTHLRAHETRHDLVC